MSARLRLRWPATAVLAVLAVLAVTGAGCSTATDPAPEAHVFTGVNAVSTFVSHASKGGALFFQNCASCHGADGHGGFGPDLRSSAVAHDYQQVYEQVLQGRGLMPGFAGVLTQPQIRDVSSYVTDVLAHPLSLEGAQGALPPAATKASQLQAPKGIDAKAGRFVYAQDCAGCHGPDGSGGPLAAPLAQHPVGYGALIQLIVNGDVQHGMPGYQRILGAGQISQVAAYVDEVLLRGVLTKGAVQGRSGAAQVTPKG